MTRIFQPLFLSAYLLLNGSAFAYDLPAPATDKSLASDDNVQLLQKISKGVAAIARQGEKAVVSVSIYKTVQGLPPGMVDPFEFFFGPQFGRGRREAPPRKERREGGIGSGFFVDLDKGYIITNNHVVQDADEIQIKMANGEVEEGTTVGRDQNTDVAVVQIKDKKFSRNGLAQVTLGNSDELVKGDFVVAIGAPFRLESSASFGVASAVGRGNLQITKMGNFIQTDAAINPGNSGGPLLNTSGQVIGMNTAIFSTSGSDSGIGFAIPSNLVRRIADQLITKGKVVRGYIGVILQPIDPELHKSLNLPKDVNGSLIQTVSEKSPAAKGGLEAGDVIVSIDKQPIRSDSDVLNIVGLLAPGTAAHFSYYRDGKPKETTVKIEQRPDDEEGAAPAKASDELYGLSLSRLTPPVKDQYQITAKSGIVITDVKPGSEGDRVGLQAGDVIIEANGKPVKDVEGFKTLVKKGPRALVRILREGQYHFVPLRNK